MKNKIILKKSQHSRNWFWIEELYFFFFHLLSKSIIFQIFEKTEKSVFLSKAIKFSYIRDTPIACVAKNRVKYSSNIFIVKSLLL